MAVIGTWRDNMRTDDALGKQWFAKHGMDELVNDVITRCPTKALTLKNTASVSKAAGISSVAVNDTQSLEVDNHNCVRCMHCINVMTGALAAGKDKGVTILVGGKSVLKIGATMGTVIVPFMKMQSDEDFDALVELAQNCIDFFAENALEHERTGEMIDRIGLVNFLEGIGVDIDPNMMLHPRANPYVRTGGWDEEVEKDKQRRANAA
jgi:sulfite reductase alpha subunit